MQSHRLGFVNDQEPQTTGESWPRPVSHRPPGFPACAAPSATIGHNFGSGGQCAALPGAKCNRFDRRLRRDRRLTWYRVACYLRTRLHPFSFGRTGGRSLLRYGRAFNYFSLSVAGTAEAALRITRFARSRPAFRKNSDLERFSIRAALTIVVKSFRGSLSEVKCHGVRV